AGTDVLVTPAAGDPPAWRESGTSDYTWTLPWNLTGAPAVVPRGGSAVQVIARPWEEAYETRAHLGSARPRRRGGACGRKSRDGCAGRAGAGLPAVRARTWARDTHPAGKCSGARAYGHDEGAPTMWGSGAWVPGGW